MKLLSGDIEIKEILLTKRSKYQKGIEVNMSESKKLKVAFVCVHNSCRSQIAEALGKLMACDVFESFSAGTETKPQINQDAVRIIRDMYDIDMEKNQYSKLLNDIPAVDIVITMGCNVACPMVPCRYREDWGLDDPTGKSDKHFIETAKIIENKILYLKSQILEGKIK